MAALNLQAISTKVGPFEQAYTWRDVALYALAVGAGTEDLDFLLDPSPKVLPTWGVIPAFAPVFAALEHTGGDLVQLLHSGQRTELIKPFPAAGVMQTDAEVVGIWDMRVGALIHIQTETRVSGELHARTLWSLLIRGAGGFESERPPPLLRTKPPKGAEPDFSRSWTTSTEQALIYRLTGDVNPIHAQPEVARAAGFERPILHGLCSYGFAAHAALKAFADGDPARFKALDARFTTPVLPGQKLLARGYVIEPGKAALTVAIEDTGELAIANALFEYEP
jgi:acyl dehydratase